MKTHPPRRYYSLRTGQNSGAVALDLSMLKKLWRSRIDNFLRNEYFQGAFGKDCVDGGGEPGELGDDVEGHILLKIRKSKLWPIREHLDGYTEDDLFDMTEFLYDCVSKPSGGRLHSWNECGWHHDTFDKAKGRQEFRAALNELLRDYGSGYELSEDGEIIGASSAGEHFVSARPMRRSLTFAPSVFLLPENLLLETDLVALMMPFEASFGAVHAAIRSACDTSGYRCVRVDDIWEDSAVVQDIFQLICRAHIVVVDFSGKNPNVMYETGIAHTLGKNVVPIAQSRADVPFDLQHHRYLSYLPNGEGLKKLSTDLAARLAQLRPLPVAAAAPIPQSPLTVAPDDEDFPF